MFRSARALFALTLVVSVLGFVMALDDSPTGAADLHLGIQAPGR